LSATNVLPYIPTEEAAGFDKNMSTLARRRPRKWIKFIVKTPPLSVDSTVKSTTEGTGGSNENLDGTTPNSSNNEASAAPSLSAANTAPTLSIQHENIPLARMIGDINKFGMN